MICPELRRIAGRYLRRERVGHTLQPPALVHEAYVKLIDQDRARWQNRAHLRKQARCLASHRPPSSTTGPLRAWLLGNLKEAGQS